MALSTLSLKTKVTLRRNWVREESFKERKCPEFNPPGYRKNLSCYGPVDLVEWICFMIDTNRNVIKS